MLPVNVARMREGILIRRKSVGQIAVIAALMMTAACIAIAVVVGNIRQHVIDDAQRANDTMASILSQQVLQSVEAIDLVLGDVIAGASLPTIDSDADLRREMGTKSAYEFLVDRLGHLPQADVISVADSSGQLIASTRSWPVPDANLSARDPFKYIKDHRVLSLLIGASQTSLVSGNQIVYFSRRLENRHGDFLGEVTVGVRPEFFLRLYDGISAVPGAFVRLLRPDGQVLVSYPIKISRNELAKNSKWHAVVANGGGHFRSGGRSEQVRLMTVLPLEGYPIVVNAGVDESAVGALWRGRATAVGLASLAVAVAVTALVCILFLLYRKAVEAQARFAAQSRELADANLRFDTVLTNLQQGVAMFDRENRIVIHNRSFAEMYGLSSDEMAPGTKLATIVDLRIANGIYAGASHDEYRYRQQNHVEKIVDSHYSVLEHMCDGRYILVSYQRMPGGAWITTHEDVTERQQAAAQITHMARHDALTGLANRTLFLERLQDIIRDTHTCFAVLIVDLDAFKAVNDTFGHPVGDALLVAVAARLGEAIEPEDIVARLGGDEFAILRRLTSLDIGPALALAASLLTSIREPYQIDDREVKIGLSIGIAAAAGVAIEPSEIMRNADLALYRAKADGRNCFRLFDPAMAEEIQSRRELAIALDATLVRGQLAVHYQPIVNAATLDTIAMEALARWSHPVRGDIAPDTFIPLAEEAGLIVRLGAFVLETACRDALAWPSSVKVSVNVSPLQVTRSDLVSMVAQALAKTGLPPQRLQIEITESVLLCDDDHNLAVLQELRDSGITIVLDDFGKGFSSLGYLNRFPLDKIKIDRSFIDRFGVDAGSAAIVAAVTSIAHAFEAITTAEGVETEEQYRRLQATEVAEMQGYLFGAPQPLQAWDFRGLKAVLRTPGSAEAEAA